MRRATRPRLHGDAELWALRFWGVSGFRVLRASAAFRALGVLGFSGFGVFRVFFLGFGALGVLGFWGFSDLALLRELEGKCLKALGFVCVCVCVCFRVLGV